MKTPESNVAGVIKWRANTKIRIVKSMGGKCACCGYDAYSGALELHHIEPKDKELSFGGVRANPVSWAKMVIELRKCILVCSNCHKEIEGNIRDIPDVYPRFNEEYADYKEIREPSKRICYGCKEEYETFNKAQRYCSPGCARKSSRKTERPTKISLKKMIDTMSWIAIGKKFGVSDNSVRSWAKLYGLI